MNRLLNMPPCDMATMRCDEEEAAPMHGSAGRSQNAVRLSSATVCALVAGVLSAVLLAVAVPVGSASAVHRCVSFSAGGFRLSGVRVFSLPCALGKAAVRAWARAGFRESGPPVFRYGGGSAGFLCYFYPGGGSPDGKCKGGVRRGGRLYPFGTIDWARRTRHHAESGLPAGRAARAAYCGSVNAETRWIRTVGASCGRARKVARAFACAGNCSASGFTCRRGTPRRAGVPVTCRRGPARVQFTRVFYD